jgi:hypothetical protein
MAIHPTIVWHMLIHPSFYTNHKSPHDTSQTLRKSITNYDSDTIKSNKEEKTFIFGTCSIWRNSRSKDHA